MQDLAPLLGEELYSKIIASPSNYEDLLRGGIYIYDSIEYTNYGLKMALSFFTYARYVMFSSYIDTPFSIVEKINNDSRPADLLVKKTIYNNNRESAFTVWHNVRNYLTRNHPDFNLCNLRMASQGFRISKIT